MQRMLPPKEEFVSQNRSASLCQRRGRYYKFCCLVGSVWFWLLADGKMLLPRASHYPWQPGENRDDAGDCFACSDKQTSLCP